MKTYSVFSTLKCHKHTVEQKKIKVKKVHKYLPTAGLKTVIGSPLPSLFTTCSAIAFVNV